MPLAATYVDNTSNVLAKGDYGIRIAKAGFDARNAADNDLLFNSAWPSTQIVKVVTVTGGSVVPHGLGFPPMAFILGGTSLTTTMYGQTVDDTNVYPAADGVLVIYRIDISTDIDYSYTATTSVNSLYDPNYGIKMVKSGLDINSTDMRDYILHSRCGSPLVLAVKTQATSSPSNTDIVQYTSKLGYPTLNFGYIGIQPGGGVGNNAYIFAPQNNQSYPAAFTDGFTVYVTLLPSGSFFNGKGSVICLRSPMFATTNNVTVNF